MHEVNIFERRKLEQITEKIDRSIDFKMIKQFSISIFSRNGWEGEDNLDNDSEFITCRYAN